MQIQSKIRQYLHKYVVCTCVQCIFLPPTHRAAKGGYVNDSPTVFSCACPCCVCSSNCIPFVYMSLRLYSLHVHVPRAYALCMYIPPFVCLFCVYFHPCVSPTVSCVYLPAVTITLATQLPSPISARRPPGAFPYKLLFLNLNNVPHSTYDNLYLVRKLLFENFGLQLCHQILA